MSFSHHIRNKFVAGVLAAIPLAVTAFLIWYVEGQTRQLFHLRTPFLGIALAIAGVYLLGLIVTSVLGRLILRGVDKALSCVPGLRELYTAWKHISINPDDAQSIFSRVVLFGDGVGVQSIGFGNGRPLPGDGTLTCIFVPAAPNPTSGRLYLVPLAQCRFLDVEPEEAFKMILSGGNYLPNGLAPTQPPATLSAASLSPSPLGRGLG